MGINITSGQASQMTAHELHAKSHQPAVAAELGQRLAQVDGVMAVYSVGVINGEEYNPQQLTAFLDRIEHILNSTKEPTK